MFFKRNGVAKDGFPGGPKPWHGDSRSQEPNGRSQESRATRVFIPLEKTNGKSKNEPRAAQTLNDLKKQWSILNTFWNKGSKKRSQPSRRINAKESKVHLTPVYDGKSPYYKTVMSRTNNIEKSSYDSYEDYYEDVGVGADENRRRHQPRRRKKPVKLAQPSYAAPSPTSYQPPEQVVVYQEPRQYHGGGGIDASAVLLGFLPLLLIGGLALGLALPFNGTLGSAGSAGSSTVSNSVSIGGDSINNTFVPTNTVDQTNTDNDVDYVDITNNNTNDNVVKRRRRKKRSSNEKKNDVEVHYFNHSFSLSDYVMMLLGSSKDLFLSDFVRSVFVVTPWDIYNGMATLVEKIWCMTSFNATEECEDQLVCDHLSDDHEVYENNMLIRGGEMFVVMLKKYLWSTDPDISAAIKAIDLMDMASEHTCLELRCTNLTLVNQCLKENP